MSPSRKERARQIQREIGAAIERRRAAKSISPAALAEAAEIDLSQLLKILAGRTGVSLYSLDRIERALGCAAGEIRAASGSRPAPRRSAARGVSAR